MWLIVLVFVGTIAQRDNGLYLVQKEYFYSWIKWFGPIPTPSAKLSMLVIFVNLSCYFFKSGIWKLKKIGITITHCGVMLILIGSALTYLFSVEGNMIIDEGNRSNYFENYYTKEFAIINTSNPEEVVTNKLRIDLKPDKNTGTIKILFSGKKQRVDVAFPNQVPSCASLDSNDLVMPKGQSTTAPDLTNSVCKTVQDSTRCPTTHPNAYTGILDGKTTTMGFCCNGTTSGGACVGGDYIKCPKPPCIDSSSPDYLNAKTTCNNPKWDLRLKESIQAHNISSLGPVCGQWCLPDKYDSRVIYSWNPGKQAFDINSPTCSKFKGEVFQHFLKIQT